MEPINELALGLLFELPIDFEAAATKTGWLQKRGQVNVSLQKRFFQLHFGKLTYYETGLEAAKRSAPKGEILICGFGHLIEEDAPEIPLPKHTNAFRVEGIDGKRVVLVAATVEDKFDWLRVLRKTISAGRRTKHQSIGDFCKHLIDGPAAGWEEVAKGVAALAAGDKATARSTFASVPHALSATAGRRLSSAGVVGGADISEVALAWVYAQTELGVLRAERREWVEALKHYDTAAAAAPSSIRRVLTLRSAWCSWQLKQFDVADEVYSALLEDDPLCTNALLDRARMRIRLGLWSLALSDLELATALVTDTADIANDRGVCHFEIGRLDDAFTEFSKALEINGAFPAAVTNRANCLREQGKLREAEEDYSRAIELEEGRNPKSFINRGLMLEAQTKFTRALPDYKRAFALVPDDPNVLKKVEELTAKLRDAGLLEEETEEARGRQSRVTTRL